MNGEFHLPAELLGRFAVVKLWPGIATAEDECIARLKAAAHSIGVECVEIYANGRFVDSEDKVISKNDADFVIHLHYETPKLYDVFSFVALWNPLKFYHEWGYERCSRNLLTHDDFLSCSSSAADDHVARMVRGSATHLPALFNLYHSVSTIMHQPTLGDRKLFYAGINWDVIVGGKSRHQKLLNRLDKTGVLRIYGPTIFQGCKVWDGYDSYVREIPFDGISMVDEIAKVGIALVLSSEAHKESELMSSRLFESIAAGALVICDENGFAKRFFGDSLLYIDTRGTVDEVCDDILKHISWAEANVDQALQMARKAQDIFRKNFSLQMNLRDLYLKFEERRSILIERQYPDERPRIHVGLNFLLPEYSLATLHKYMASVNAQDYEEFSPVLIVDRTVYRERQSEIETLLATAKIRIEIFEIDFFTYCLNPLKRPRRKLGDVLAEIIARPSRASALVFVAPNERIFSNHLRILAGSLARNPERNCAATAVILKNGEHPIHSTHEKIDFADDDPMVPNGFARFIFRSEVFPGDLNIALRYLDGKALAVLINDDAIIREIPSTVVIEVDNPFPPSSNDADQQNAIINAFAPRFFEQFSNIDHMPPTRAAPSLDPSVPPETATVAVDEARLRGLKRLTAGLLRVIRAPGR